MKTLIHSNDFICNNTGNSSGEWKNGTIFYGWLHLSHMAEQDLVAIIKRQNLLKAKKDKEFWRAMITNNL